MRRGLVMVTAAVCALVGANAAEAGTLSRDGSVVVYTEPDADATQNIVEIATAGDRHFIGDMNDFVDPGSSGCTGPGTPGTFLDCGTSVTGFRIILGGGNDIVSGFASCCGARALVPISAEGGPGSDSMTGGSANDTLDGGSDADTFNGLDGTDVVTYASRTAGVTVNLGAGGADDGSAEDGAPGARDTINATDIETVVGGSGADDLRGRTAADVIDGGPGGDTLNALAGQDTVRGGSGIDNIEARDGEVDSVDCGPDEDAATTDPGDPRVNCDPVPANEPSGNTPSGGGGGTTIVTNTVTLTLPSRARLDLAYTFSAGRRSTTLRNLGLEVERGARLAATCRTRRGRRCTGTRDLARAAPAASLRLRGFERARLPVGARLQIRVTKDGMIGAVKTLTIRKRRAPSVRTLCLPPGATRPGPC